MEDRHRLLEDLFERARTLAPDALGEFLARECAGDPALCRELEELLAFAGATHDPAVRLPFESIAPPVTPAVPKQIGPYRILRALCTGGMGTVYEATQQHPQRTVAVKTVRPGFLSAISLRRFQAEIEVLARLRHPGIAQIYDAGVHDEGSVPTPYFAMEYIPDAEPITDWVRQRRLPLDQTLALFAAVCDAVHHAHRQSVIHRDLKPANILVDASQEAPVPKIIDFGIARGRLQKGLVGPPGPVGIGFGPDDERIVVGNSDGEVRLWDVMSLETPVLRGHSSYVYPVAVSPDGASILSGGWDGYVGRPGCLRVWDAASGDPITAFGDADRSVLAAAIAPDGVHAAVASSGPNDHAVTLIDLRTGAARDLVPPGPVQVQALAFDPEGRRLAIAAVYGRVRILEIDSGRTVLERSLGTETDWFNWYNQPRLAWRPDGHFIAVGTQSGSIELWDGRSFEPTRRLEGHGDVVRSLAFSRDGRLLASASKDKTVRVWEVETGGLVAGLRGHDQDVLAVAFSPDGQRLASGGHDKKIRLWDTATWEQVAELGGHEWYVYSLAWSPDGERLVSGSGDGTVRIWETPPVDARIRARKDRKEILARVEPLMMRLLDQLGDGREVAARLAADTSLTVREREVALQALLRESVARRGRKTGAE